MRESHRRMVEAFERSLAAWPEEAIVALAAGLDRLREDFREPVAEEATAA